MIEIIQKHLSIMAGAIDSSYNLISENMLSYSLTSHQILVVRWGLSWRSESYSVLSVLQVKMGAGSSTSIYNQ
jgi:hypothetical protein